MASSVHEFKPLTLHLLLKRTTGKEENRSLVLDIVR